MVSSLVENIPGAVYRFKLDGSYTTVFYSEYYLQLTGYPASDFLTGKMQFRELIHPDDVDWLDEDINSAIGAKKAFQHEFRLFDKAGKCTG